MTLARCRRPARTTLTFAETKLTITSRRPRCMLLRPPVRQHAPEHVIFQNEMMKQRGRCVPGGKDDDGPRNLVVGLPDELVSGFGERRDERRN
jgi:hypothetical protein